MGAMAASQSGAGPLYPHGPRLISVFRVALAAFGTPAPIGCQGWSHVLSKSYRSEPGHMTMADLMIGLVAPANLALILS